MNINSFFMKIRIIAENAQKPLHDGYFKFLISKIGSAKYNTHFKNQ